MDNTDTTVSELAPKNTSGYATVADVLRECLDREDVEIEIAPKGGLFAIWYTGEKRHRRKIR